jgi:hypothetical protein
VVFSGSSGSTNKTDRHDIADILLKVALNTIKQANKTDKIQQSMKYSCYLIDSDDHVGGIGGCGKTYTKRQKTLEEYDFKKGDIPKIQGDKEITPKEENMHVGEVTKGDNFQNHNINSEKDQSKLVDYESKHSHRSRSTGEKSRHSGEHKKHTKDKGKDSKSSSRRESTDEESRYLHESRSKREDSKSSNRRELTDEKPVHSNTYKSEQRCRKHESEPSQKVEISPVKHKDDFKEEKSLDNSYHREEKKKKLDDLKFKHTEDLKDSHQNESPKDKPKQSDKQSERTKVEDSRRWHRIESPDKKSSHSHKNEYKPTRKHCDTTKDDFEFFFGMKSPFSQFHPAKFVVRDVKYNCAEQFMMHQKAGSFSNLVIPIIVVQLLIFHRLG